MMKYPNRTALYEAHNIYRDVMQGFIVRRLKKVQGITPKELISEILKCESIDDPEAMIDIRDFPRIMRDRNCWFDAFSQLFGSRGAPDVRSMTGFIADGRKLWAHPQKKEDVDSEHTRTHLSIIADLLGAINELDARDDVENIRDQLFSDEVEEHPTEVENAALNKRLADTSDKLAAVEADKIECEKRLQDAQERLEELEEIETAWMDSEKQAEKMLNELEAAKAKQRASEKKRKSIVSELESAKTEKSKLTEDLNTASSWLEDVEKEKVELKKRLKKAETEKTELKENLKSRSDRLEKLEKVKKENAELKKDLETAAEEKAELEKQLKTKSDSNIPDSVTFQETTFTMDLDKYRVVGDDITQTFWRYWHAQRSEGKQAMRDAGWSVEKVDGDWEITISTEDFQAWTKNEGSTTQPTAPFQERTELPTGKEMEQPALELLSDRREYPRSEIIDVLTQHFSLNKNQRKKLSRSGKAEVYLRNKGLIERTRTGYYRITSRGLDVLRS